jgi:hypothetical protein
MTQTPHDQLAKLYLEEFLAPFGVVERQYEVPGEAKYVDVWFVPNRSPVVTPEMGILARMTERMCLLEPFHDAPSRTEVRTCVLKLLWVQENERGKAKKEALPEGEQPLLWILAATVSRPLLADAGGMVKADWLPGIYFMPELFKTAIVAINELPETEETLWLRVLGRDETQARAIRAVLALPRGYPKRDIILRMLASWKVRMDMGELADFTNREAIMGLTEAFLTWEQEKEIQSKQEERQAIALNLLKQGMLSIEAIAQATGLTIEQVQSLQAQSENDR